VIDPSGYLVTNAHLVADGQEIVVRLADRREFEAKVVGFDVVSDIALLKIEAGFRAALQAAGKGASVALLVQRDGTRQFLPLRLPR